MAFASADGELVCLLVAAAPSKKTIRRDKILKQLHIHDRQASIPVDKYVNPSKGDIDEFPEGSASLRPFPLQIEN